MYRLFVALDLPQAVKTQLSLMSYGLPGARWSTPDQMHLTLRFIGEVERPVFDDIAQALDEVQMDVFDLALEGVGYFEARGKPSVLWLGLEKNEPLLQLQRKIEKVIVQCGLEPEGRKYSPHITLARLKDTPVSWLTQYISEHLGFKTEPFEVAEFHLYSSQLTSKGPIYQIEETYQL